MYGTSIFNDEVLKTVEKNCTFEKKPDIFAPTPAMVPMHEHGYQQPV